MTPRDAREAREREAVLTHSSVICECGHHLSWHGEDYEGGCSHEGCECGHNAAQAYAHGSLDPEPLDAYVRTVRATTDAAWESRIREACEAGRKEHSLDCLVHVVQNTPDICDCDAKDHNSALSALLARLGIPEEGR